MHTVLVSYKLRRPYILLIGYPDHEAQIGLQLVDLSV
jgi:hypothetical protein